MYLLPTQKEMNALWHQINPTARIMDYLYSRPPTEGSMAEFFMESEDVELTMEDDCTEFDYIEDDILNMRRDINGFRIQHGHQNFDEYAGIDLGGKSKMGGNINTTGINFLYSFMPVSTYI